MRTHRKYLPYLYFFLASLIPLLLFVLLFDPTGKLNVLGTEIGYPLFLFLLLFTNFLALGTFIFASRRRGILSALFFDGVLILRFFGFRSLFQVIILLVIILLVEFLYARRQVTTSKKSS